MSDALNRVYDAVDREHSKESAYTRRNVVATAATTIGALGLFGVPSAVAKTHKKHQKRSAPEGNNDPKTILQVAATAEVLATIINTVALTRVKGFDAVTTRNLQAAAREELTHYTVLTFNYGVTPLTKTVYIPDAVFASPQSLLNAVIVGDQVFINAYLVATTAFGNAGNGELARIAAEFMGVEAVHRAVARQSLGLLGNDRAFIKYTQTETAAGPNVGAAGFTDILDAVKQLEAAGIGFGKPNPNVASNAQTGYEFDVVSATTPDVPDVNVLLPA